MDLSRCTVLFMILSTVLCMNHSESSISPSTTLMTSMPDTLSDSILPSIDITSTQHMTTSKSNTNVSMTRESIKVIISTSETQYIPSTLSSNGLPLLSSSSNIVVPVTISSNVPSSSSSSIQEIGMTSPSSDSDSVLSMSTSTHKVFSDIGTMDSQTISSSTLGVFPTSTHVIDSEIISTKTMGSQASHIDSSTLQPLIIASSSLENAISSQSVKIFLNDSSLEPTSSSDTITSMPNMLDSSKMSNNESSGISMYEADSVTKIDEFFTKVSSILATKPVTVFDTTSRIDSSFISSSEISIVPRTKTSSIFQQTSFLFLKSSSLVFPSSSLSPLTSASSLEDIIESTISTTAFTDQSVLPTNFVTETLVSDQSSSVSSLLQPSPTPSPSPTTSLLQTIHYSIGNGSFVPTSVAPKYKVRNNFRIAITFKDHCRDLKNSERLLEQFSVAIEAELKNVIGHATLEDIHCNPLTAVIVLYNVSKDTAIKEIEKHLGNASFTVPVIYEGQLLEYTASGVSMFVLPTNGDPRLAETVMDELDIAIIAIGSFFFMVLLFFGSVIICRQCYLRKRAASFNLLDTPRSDLKLTDYTLTRIPRPRVIYCDPKQDRSRQALSDHKRKNKVYNSTDTTDNVHAALNPEDFRVRMHNHAGGLVVGITCTPPPTPVHDSESSSCSSPRSDTEDQSSKQLLERSHLRRKKGTENPNFEETDEIEDKTYDSIDIEKEENDIEQMV